MRVRTEVTGAGSVVFPLLFYFVYIHLFFSLLFFLASL